MLGGNKLALRASALFSPRCEKVALVAESKIHLLLQRVEEIDAFSDQFDLLRVVELEAEGPGRNGCR
jgi:hypothetical protein